MDVSQFDFEYPDSLVAQEASPRGASRILFCPKNGAERSCLKAAEIVDLFRAGDCLVLNNTKVIPARLRGVRDTGSPWEILLVQPDPQDPVLWQAMIRPGKSFKVGRFLEVYGVKVETVAVREDGLRLLKFHCTEAEFWSLLDRAGKMPLPPYIQREATAEDEERYQTLWAKKEGAVAAPTASLHFSAEMLQSLRDKGVQLVEVTLHVGPGTFKPIEVEDAREHPMHSERFELSEEAAAAINTCKSKGGRIIAVGTTAVRVLESCADSQGQLVPRSGETQIYIYPGYEWKIVNGLMTNFHWPRSTLILLVASFYGEEQTRSAYAEAIRREMKLFSYGDGMLIMP